jgi:hypothetical protein
MGEISVKIEDNKIININNNTDKPHNGKPVTMMRVSPNGKYLITYSKDDESIVGWNVANVVEGRLKSDYIRTHKGYHEIEEICVSDDKKLAYIHDIYLGKSINDILFIYLFVVIILISFLFIRNY